MHTRNYSNFTHLSEAEDYSRKFSPRKCCIRQITAGRWNWRVYFW